MQQPPTTLTPGDRAPNFLLPDTTGVNRVFYNEVSGRPIVLMVAAAPRGIEADSALTSLRALAPDLRAAGAEIFAVISGEGAATLAERLGLDFPVFSDGRGEIVPALLARAPGKKFFDFAVASFVLDPNQRILAIITDTAGEHGAQTLRHLRRWNEQEREALVLQSTAPILMLPNVFDPDFCRTLIEAWQKNHEEGHVSTGARNLYAPDKKKNLEHTIADVEFSRRISLTLARRIGPELRKVFGWSAPFRFEAHYILSYRDDRQDFFGVHRDNLRQTDKRRFAVSLNLNEDYDGGELRFPEYGPHRYRPAAGSACVFSCNLLHEALPVTRGQRWVLVAFFCEAEAPDPNIPAERRRQLQI